METFDINKIVANCGHTVEELACMLFPQTKYPLIAFSRVLEGKRNLDTSQLHNLASYLGCTIYDLFSIDDWKGSREDGCLTFLRGCYKVKLAYKGVYLSLYKKEQLIYQEISPSVGMTIEEFINHINEIIKNQENGNN